MEGRASGVPEALTPPRSQSPDAVPGKAGVRGGGEGNSFFSTGPRYNG